MTHIPNSPLPSRLSAFAGLSLLVASSLGLGACAPKDGGQVGEENLGCQSVLSEPLTLDGDNPLGFTIAQVLELAEGDHQSALSWADGNDSVLHASLVFSGEASYEDREWIDDGSGIEPALVDMDCNDILRMQVQVELSSEDGALDESYALQLEAGTSDEAHLSTELPTLTGSLVIEDFAPAGSYSSFRAFLDLSITSAGLSGTISGQAESSGSGGDDGTVSATSFAIASFGSP